MARVTHLGFAAAVLAIVGLPFGGSSARAFTLQNSDGSSAGSARFSDPDVAVKNSGSAVSPFGEGGPTVQFNAGPPGVNPFGRVSPCKASLPARARPIPMARARWATMIDAF